MATILIADDDPIVRQIAIELLRDGDHVVLQAEHGREALRLVQAIPIDILIVDVLMPEMDGLETILALRQSHQTLKMLAISAGGQIGARPLLETARAFGAHATLQNPLSRATFRPAVEQLLAESGTRSTATSAAASAVDTAATGA